METIRVARPDGAVEEETADEHVQLQRPVKPPGQRLATPRTIRGSLPLNLNGDEDSPSPVRVFSPPHLYSAPPALPIQPPAVDDASSNGVARSLALTTTTGDTSGENGSTPSGSTTANGSLTGATADDDAFLQRAQEMLGIGKTNGIPSRFAAKASDASYDFDEYILLRDPDDPIASDPGWGPGAGQAIPADPRFFRFVEASSKAIGRAVDQARLPLGNLPGSQVYIHSVQQTMTSWWYQVCAIRAFNRLGRYSLAKIRSVWPEVASTREAYYAESLWGWLATMAAGEIQAFLLSNGDSDTLGKLITTAFWEETLDAVFGGSFDDRWTIDPSAPDCEYPFDPFPDDEVLFGLRLVHRQTWRLLDYPRGDLVKTIPLGPRETQKVSVKTVRRTRRSRTNEQSTSFETSAETSENTKDTSEVVAEASFKQNRHLEAEVGAGLGPFLQAKVSGGISDEFGRNSKSTKTRLNDVMEKTANRMRRDTKVIVSTESEESFEVERSSELVNPNDEIAITYLYHRLQQRYWVSTELAEAHSVVFVPEPLPAWDEITEAWVIEHGEMIAGALLDPSFGPVLAAIRKEPNLTYSSDHYFVNSVQTGIDAASAYRDFTGGGRMPDLLASGQEYYARDFERREGLRMDMLRRGHQLQALLMHIRRNILHYMRAIWASEDYDQRMQRYSRMRVASAWTFVPLAKAPAGSNPASPLEVEGIFIPDAGSARPLTEVIDPIGPIGYLFNCAIYRLRDDPRIVNLHQALAYLRAAYTRFTVRVTPSAGAGVTVRAAVALAPRSFSADYTFTYRSNHGKWLIPRPNLHEGDWFEVKVMPDGGLDALGLRIWLNGTPNDKDDLTIRLRATRDLEDPHLRLVQMQSPLPPAADEAALFAPELLRDMASVLPELAGHLAKTANWDDLPPAAQAAFRALYHRYLVLRESGRMVTLDTADPVLDLEVSNTPALEEFKRLHRYLDVQKEFQELHRRALDNERRKRLIDNDRLGDPDIERVTLVGTSAGIANAIALPEEIDE